MKRNIAPAPWEVGLDAQPDRIIKLHILAADKRKIALIWGDKKQMHNNALLMSKAPQMLELLRKNQDDCDGRCIDCGWWGEEHGEECKLAPLLKELEGING
jgi:hypothetical protein